MARLSIRLRARPVAPGSRVSGGAEMPIVSVPPDVPEPLPELADGLLLPQAASSGASPSPAASVAPAPSACRRETSPAGTSAAGIGPGI